MSASNTANIGKDMRRIHYVITRGLTVATEHSQSPAASGLADAALRGGFVSYVQTLVAVTTGHHLLEDELAFPSFRDGFPEAPYEMLQADHQQMVIHLDAIKAAIQKVADAGQTDESLSALNDSLKSLADIWLPHIRVEEEHFSIERAETRLSPEENAQLSRTFGEHSQKHIQPDYLVVPFLLYNVTPDEREGYVRAMPPVVTEQLVPFAWKEKWAPMLPFLLP